MFSIKQTGNFEKTSAFLSLAASKSYLSTLDSLGQRGVNALRSATPSLSGATAIRWRYEIKRTPTSYSITWLNDELVGSVPLAVLLQYGHGTRNGGYVQGRDYINPTMQPIFDTIANEAWAALTRG